MAEMDASIGATKRPSTLAILRHGASECDTAGKDECILG